MGEFCIVFGELEEASPMREDLSITLVNKI